MDSFVTGFHESSGPPLHCSPVCRAQLVSRSRATPQASWDEIEDGECGGSAGTDSGEDWAHLIATPEPGCVLLANPMLFGSSQTYFEQAVILVIEHSDQGSMGIILNKPSELRLKQMEDVVLDSQFRVFAKNKVYLGGDVDADGLYLLHEHRVPGAAQVWPHSALHNYRLPLRWQNDANVAFSSRLACDTLLTSLCG